MVIVYGSINRNPGKKENKMIINLLLAMAIPSICFYGLLTEDAFRK